MQARPFRPRRSALYVPASNDRALAKVASLACDAVIIDLEDAVGPDEKVEARETMRRFVSAHRPAGKEVAVRINALSSEWGTEDLLAARGCVPDAIVLPKVASQRDLLEAEDALDQMDAPETLALWAMVETPQAMLQLGAICERGHAHDSRLTCLVAGSNDLAKETGVRGQRHLEPWLMQILLAGRAGGLSVLDGVSNDFKDLDAFSRACGRSRDMGFDGKTLIHPAQIGPANHAFSPTQEEIAEATMIVSAFQRPENATRGVISIDGRMVERLHLEQARRILTLAQTTEGARDETVPPADRAR